MAKAFHIRRVILAVEMALAALAAVLVPGPPRYPVWMRPLAIVVVVAGAETLRRLLARRMTPRSDRLKDLGDWVLRSAMHGEEQAAPLPFAPPLPDDVPIASRTVHDPSVPANVNHWFRALRHELLRTDAEVQAAYKMECDLNLAKDFQRSYLERPYPEVAAGGLRLRFHHYYAPAMSLGGDFFDISAFGPGSAGVMVADVMGHGARSALITAILRSLISDLSVRGRDVPSFMRELNRRYTDMLRNVPEYLFVSAFYWYADLARRKAFFTTAGHPAPFHISRRRGFIHQLNVLTAHGSALGLDETAEYPSEECPLQEDDIFLFFTDGVYEARNDQQEEYGEERMTELLRDAISLPASRMVEQLVFSVNQFVSGRPFEDDVCIVAVEVVPEQEKR